MNARLPISTMVAMIAHPLMSSHATPPFEIPRADGPAGALSAPWVMTQSWLPRPQPGFLAGSVRTAWSPAGLRVVADLPDREVSSKSTAHGQHLWTLGDVFEIFLQREGSNRYLELHISPNNHRLHLRWSAAAFDRVRTGRATIGDVAADPGAFESEVTRLPRGRGWRVSAFIPAAAIPGARPLRRDDMLRLSFSRYDTDHRGGGAVLSSTSPHAAPSYHRRHEWRAARLAGPR